MKKIAIAACLLAGVMANAADSHAVVMDFESLMHTDDQIAEHGPSYTEKGFQIVNTATEETSGFAPAFATLGTDIYGFSGSTALFNNNYMGTTVLSQIGNGLFNLNSITLSELLPAEETFSIIFKGVLEDASIVTQLFTLDGFDGAQTFSFNSDFRNLMSVSWDQTDYFHQFDNIDVSAAAPVPEPSTLFLFGAGLFGLAAARRKFGHRPDALA